MLHVRRTRAHWSAGPTMHQVSERWHCAERRRGQAAPGRGKALATPVRLHGSKSTFACRAVVVVIVCLFNLAGGTRSYLLSAFAVDALMTVGVLAMVAHWAGLREPIEALRHAFIGVLKAQLTSGLLCISAAPRAVVDDEAEYRH